MDKKKRSEIKKKGKKLYLIGYGLGIWGAALLVCTFATPLLDLIRNVTENGSETFRLILIILLVMFIMLPLLFSLFVVSLGSFEYQKLHNFKRDLWEEQNKFHAKLFWDAIQAKDYEEAKRLYNIDKFIFGSMRVLCNGILMGIATQTPIDEDWKEKVNDRMNSYLK